MADGFRLFFNNGWRHHDIAAILDFVRHLTIWVFCFEGKIMELDFANTYIHQIIVIVSTHNALLFEIKSTLFCVNVVALSWAAWIIISIILTCYRWWYLLLVLLVLRPSISSLLQSARGIAKYDITIVSSLRTYFGPYFMSGGCKLANMEFKAYVMVYWPF